MKDLQLRFGIVLLVIISVVSFMIGRSLKPILDARSRGDVVLGVSGNAAASSADEEGGEPRI